MLLYQLFLSTIFLLSLPNWESPLPLDWPFNSGSIQPVAIGWGDWTPSSEGPHPGLDFSGNASDSLRNPLTISGYIIGQHPITIEYLTYYDMAEGYLVFASNLPGVSNWGWQYDHISYDVNKWLVDYEPGTEVATSQVFELIPNPDQCIWPHTHVYWGLGKGRRRHLGSWFNFSRYTRNVSYERLCKPF